MLGPISCDHDQTSTTGLTSGVLGLSPYPDEGLERGTSLTCAFSTVVGQAEVSETSKGNLGLNIPSSEVRYVPLYTDCYEAALALELSLMECVHVFWLLRVTISEWRQCSKESKATTPASVNSHYGPRSPLCAFWCGMTDKCRYEMGGSQCVGMV